MPKYIAKTPIKHDGKRYSVGDGITLKADDAAGLLTVGAVVLDRAEAEAKAKAEAEAKALQDA